MGHRIAVALAMAVVAITFGLGAKRRAVRSGDCTPPVLNLTASPTVACPSDAITLQWRASDSRAVVTIDGIGDRLAATGSTRITDGRRRFTGFATNTCARGAPKTIEVSAPAQPTGSILGPHSIKQHASTTLRVTASDSSFWILSSSLSNPISPSSGFGDDEATYTGSRSGTDGVLLRITGACGTTDRVTTLIVEPVSPPPGGGYLRCCDGTVSPTCRDCNNKRGCCSSHGGVCGC